MRMRKRLLCLFLVLSMTLAVMPEVFATDAGNLTDIKGHWAQAPIIWSVVEGYFQGTSDTTFSPSTTMSRAMFVTVLGRFAGIDPSDYQDWYISNLFTDVPENSYYAPYINWALRMGITKGTSDWKFSPNEPVSRQQMAVFLQRYASIYNYEMTSISAPSSDAFLDGGSIASYAVDAVEAMRLTGILTGRADQDGLVFAPNDGASRAECAVVLERLSRSLKPYTGRTVVEPADVQVSPASESLWLGQSLSLSSSVLPAGSSNQTITWVSDAPGVAKVDLNGKVTAVNAGTAHIYAYTWNGCYTSATITCAKAPDLASSDESRSDKMVRIFGEVVSDPRRVYQSDEEARSHMVTISIRVWDFADSTRTTKITKTQYLTVHENIADTVKAIFEEIYNGPEKFPIYGVGCYRWEPGSEHMPGLAIDINYNENYECTIDGTATVGSYWKPGEDPYSIPRGGDVETAFKRYGFGWGADWRSKKDYMHFSYFAT